MYFEFLKWTEGVKVYFKFLKWTEGVNLKILLKCTLNSLNRLKVNCFVTCFY